MPCHELIAPDPLYYGFTQTGQLAAGRDFQVNKQLPVLRKVQKAGRSYGLIAAYRDGQTACYPRSICLLWHPTLTPFLRINL